MLNPRTQTLEYCYLQRTIRGPEIAAPVLHEEVQRVVIVQAESADPMLLEEARRAAFPPPMRPRPRQEEDLTATLQRIQQTIIDPGARLDHKQETIAERDQEARAAREQEARGRLLRRGAPARLAEEVNALVDAWGQQELLIGGGVRSG